MVAAVVNFDGFRHLDCLPAASKTWRGMMKKTEAVDLTSGRYLRRNAYAVADDALGKRGRRCGHQRLILNDKSTMGSSRSPKEAPCEGMSCASARVAAGRLKMPSISWTQNWVSSLMLRPRRTCNG